MTLHDLVDLSIGSLWRIKLRAFLTIAGVVIAIATFVAMLSFAAGNQKWVAQAYNELGLLTQINVTPKDGRGRGGGHSHDDSSGDTHAGPDARADTTAGAAADTTKAAAVLDQDAVRALARIPGVRLAYPFVEFDVTARVLGASDSAGAAAPSSPEGASGTTHSPSLPDTQITTKARALSLEAMKLKPYSTLLGGAVFSSSDAGEAIVTPEFLERIGVDRGDALVGESIVLSTRAASMDSAMAGIMGTPMAEFRYFARTVRRDSLRLAEYRRALFQRELGTRAGRFMDGLLNHQMTVADTLRIVAVGKTMDEYQVPMSPVIVPEETARRFASAGIGFSSDPANLLAALQSGSLFSPRDGGIAGTYPRVTLEIEPRASHQAVIDSVEALGFKAFSFATEFKNIQRFFIYYYAGLSVIGLIALATAALGIANTMIMSISERRREIGILKSLGADEKEIQLTFLVESGTIGAVGAVIGIVLGWIGTRIVALVMEAVMRREEMPVFDPFAMPVWLIFVALLFGVAVSVAAGAYPASRAARVDPVEALRGE